MSRFPSGVLLVLTAALTAAGQPPVRPDALGDPLPAGAVARLGTTRLRTPYRFADVVFAPNSNSLATVTSRGEVCLWQAKDGRLLRRFIAEAGSGQEKRLAFSPDGSLLAAALDDRVCLWEVTTGRVVRTVEEPDRVNRYFAVTFTPDGKHFLTAGEQKAVELREVATGNVLRTLGDDKYAISSLAVSGDGRTLAVGFGGGQRHEGDFTPRLYEIATGRELRRFTPLQSATSPVSFSRDGRRLAAGNHQGVYLWEVATGQVALNLRDGHPDFVALAPDGRTFAAVKSNGGVVDLCETATGRPLRRFPNPGQSAGRAAFSPDGTTLALVSNEHGGHLRLWNLGTGVEVTPMPGHEAPLDALALSADGNTLASSSVQGQLLLWNMPSGRCLGQLPGSQEYHWPVSFSSDGRTLRCRSHEEQFTWDLQAGKVVKQSVTPAAERGRVRHSPDEAWLAVDGSGDGVVELWPAQGQQAVHRLVLFKKERRSDGRVGPLVFSPDSSLLATGSSVQSLIRRDIPPSESVHLWDVKTGRLLRKFRPSAHAPAGLAFSPDGTMLAVLDGWHEPITLWDVATARLVRPLEKPKPGPHGRDRFSRLTFCSQGKLLVAADEAGNLVLFDVATGRNLHQWRAHDAQVTALLFTPDSRTLITASVDTTILVWDVAELLPRAAQALLRPAEKPTGKGAIPNQLGGLMQQEARKARPEEGGERELHPFPAQRGTVTTLAFSPDGKHILSSGTGGLVRLTDVRTGRVVRQLEAGRHTNARWPYGAVGATFSPDGTLIAAAGADPVVRVWETQSGKQVWTRQEHTLPAAHVAFTPDGKLLASVGYEGKVCLWEVSTAKLVRSWQAHPGRATCAAFTRDGKTLYTGGVVQNDTVPTSPVNESDAVRAWEVATGKELPRAGGKAHRVLLSPDGNFLLLSAMLATYDKDGRPASIRTESVSINTMNVVTWHDVRKGKDRLTFRAQGAEATVSPDGRHLATATGMGHVFTPGEPFTGGNHLDGHDREDRVRIHDAADGRLVLQLPHQNAFAVAFAPDNRTLVTGGPHGVIRLWDVTPERSLSGASARKQSLSLTELGDLWADLGGADVPQAFRAIALLSREDRAVSFLSDKVKPRAGVLTKRLAELLADLDAKSFKTRQQAARELESLGGLAETAVRDALMRMPSLEMRKRLEEVLAKLGTTLDGETIRTLRAVEVLEVVGSAEAQRILERLATGSPLALETVTATAALNRLNAARAR